MNGDVVAVICDDIDGECVVASKNDFADKHIMMREKVRKHEFPTKNLRGQVVEGTGHGWTDMQTLVIVDLSRENLERALKQGYKIPKELLNEKGIL